ncbi:MAG: LptF/LptG family permease [Gemmatimonadetes bacterium]|nr:LptF/LptG family permease [Gemmatimonadota bacterium]NNK63155.1 YjgP/YjgQ family permease [Gemmatimonadota bacterium]
MQILTRHLIKAILGPFLFSLSALTGLLFLNAIAQRMEDLAGKGLTWDVILEFLVLSLPHTVALTLPMAVLVAVLHAFTEMTAANEITAMKAGGIAPSRILAPLLVMGALAGGVMLYFNDDVLPEANHRLKNLLLDINRKSPTFTLREQVMNRIQSEESGEVVYLRAASIDNATAALDDVWIIPANEMLRRRITYADSAEMALNASRTDLFLTLYDGVVYESDQDRPGTFQAVEFDKQIVPIRGVGNAMERNIAAAQRGDREMDIAMLNDQVDSARVDATEFRDRSAERTRETVLLALARPVADSASAEAAVRAARAQPGPPREIMVRDQVTFRALQAANTQTQQLAAAQQREHRYQVEIHKKYTLAFACIVFVLLGVPLAIRFPRGGLGMVIAASSVIFAIYWVGLISGEDLADRGVAPPVVTMWIPNVIFTVLGLWFAKNMGKETATMRGGGWDDLVWSIRKLFTREKADGAQQEASV